MLYLTVEVRHNPAHMTSPPYKMLMNWCSANNIPLVTGWMLYVYNEDPVRAVLTVIDLDEQGEWIRDENGVPVTHEVTYTCASLPPLQGYVSRGSSTLA
ncbi:hypothetical protein [Nonomuraea roseoviolacea]|uniref:Uncharacterized protein n=1 Tax=Nonomuraea roseoviolacea subsp. carminata TaxID=160689 RepID=A0ABT1KB61_9ACTN|nr:hypothetical protein [Nonomuraea roseoviolacea]MCP2350631.1 hypothetical protein [Nonomuraea roseoviolacea subsp. carminata]